MVALAVRGRDDGRPPVRLRDIAAQAGLGQPRRCGGAWIVTWGNPDRDLPAPGRPLVLAGTAHVDGARVDDADVARMLHDGDLDDLGHFLPPFAAAGTAPGGVRVAVDRMGFRQVYVCRDPGWEAVSTSSRLLAWMSNRGLDEEAVLLQSQLGWQLGSQTLYAGVDALEPGASVLVSRDGLRVDHVADVQVRPGSVSLDDAVDQASARLRQTMSHYLDGAHEPLLQLTGGMDSRLVLSSIPDVRRSGLRAMTLDVPGAADTVVASEIAASSGLDHRVVSLNGLASVPDQEWFERVVETAAAHDAMLNPVAKAATDWAEESLAQGDRLGGLGGEIARGFYYTGVVRPAPVTRRRSDRLARWRMLANEAVEPAALHARHRQHATSVALDSINAALYSGGDEWFSATDHLYYRHRMRRWAGLAETVASTRRSVVNLMLDPEFIELARNLAPRDKRQAQFLGRLQWSLDPRLGAIPLEGRPPPVAFAFPGPRGRARQVAVQSRLAARKARQRATRARRPPAGGVIVSAAVVRHLRGRPADMERLRGSGWFDADWLTAVGGGSVRPLPSTVAFMVNLLVALDDVDKEIDR